MEHHVTSKDGTQIGFKRSGSGPPLLLVHGTTADHQRWAPISPQLEPHFTVLAMDRRGRGMSGDGPEYNIMREAEDVAAVVESLDQPAAVLGHSYGGLVALEAALITGRINRLILYEPPVPDGSWHFDPSLLQRINELADQGKNEAALELFMREAVKMPEHELSRYRQLPMWQRRITIVPTIPREEAIDTTYHFEPERFARLQTPTLLFQGSDSPDLFKNTTTRLHNVLPNSRIVIFPGQQHIAMDLEPEMFVREVEKFLSETG
jgi:pimeloyl-ACP methyl ester carboxylesterase